MIHQRGLLLLAWVMATGACVGSTPHASPTARAKVTPAQRDFDAGEAFAAEGDWVRAEQYFASALRHGYPDIVVISKLLRVCLGASRLRSALGYAELYLLRHPQAWALRHLTAAIHAGLGQRAAARRALEQVLRVQSHNAPSLYLLAELEADDEARIPRARQLYAAYLELAPQGVHAESARTFLHAHGDADQGSTAAARALPESDEAVDP